MLCIKIFFSLHIILTGIFWPVLRCRSTSMFGSFTRIVLTENSAAMLGELAIGSVPHAQHVKLNTNNAVGLS